MTTLTDPIYLFTYSPREVTKDPTYGYMDQINTYFWSWHKCMKEFEVNPELNANGNLHYHGYFIIKDNVKWQKVVLPKLKYNGLMKINKVNDSLDKAMEYCRKDREEMMKIIDHKLPFTHKDKVKHVQMIESKVKIPDYFRIVKSHNEIKE